MRPKLVNYPEIFNSYSDEAYLYRLVEPLDYFRGYFQTLKPFIDKNEDQRIETPEQFKSLILGTEQSKYVHKIIVVEYKRAVIESERVIGTGCIMIRPSITNYSTAFVSDIGVRKDHQNKKIANQIITLLIEIAKKAGCKKVSLETYQEAVKFYEKRGFTKESGYYVCDISPAHVALSKLEKLKSMMPKTEYLEDKALIRKFSNNVDELKEKGDVSTSTSDFM